MSSLPPPPQPVITHCYRHPDREAGRSCTRCGRPACSQCLVQAAVGSHCLECAKAARPDVKTRARYWNARQLTLVTFALMAANIAVFVILGLEDPDAFSGGSVTRWQFDLGLNKEVLAFDHHWFRLATAGFIHFGIIHLLFNMLLLYQLGQMLETALGRVRFGLVYFAGLFGGSLGSLIVDKRAIVGGASGAVFGLLAAAAVGLHRQGVNVFSTGIGTTLLLNIVLTFSISNISVGGHVGGALAGAACGFVVLAPKWRPFAGWATYAAPAAVAALCVIGSVIVVG